MLTRIDPTGESSQVLDDSDSEDEDEDDDDDDDEEEGRTLEDSPAKDRDVRWSDDEAADLWS
eukprot:6810024-Karenia_brevis.AAC.1